MFSFLRTHVIVCVTMLLVSPIQHLATTFLWFARGTSKRMNEFLNIFNGHFMPTIFAATIIPHLNISN